MPEAFHGLIRTRCLLLHSSQVKKIFAQVVIAMAHHGYLELEGGNLMIEFVIKQCALQPNDVAATVGWSPWTRRRHLSSVVEHHQPIEGLSC